MSEAFRCGRRGPWAPNPFVFDQVEKGDHWDKNGTCSYCGSLKGEEMIERIKAGTATLIPTDKSYKVYVETVDPATRETKREKFYFQHFSREQADEFIKLHNDKTLKLGYPGHFYVAPYFCAR